MIRERRFRNSTQFPRSLFLRIGCAVVRDGACEVPVVAAPLDLMEVEMDRLTRAVPPSGTRSTGTAQAGVGHGTPWNAIAQELGDRGRFERTTSVPLVDALSHPCWETKCLLDLVSGWGGAGVRGVAGLDQAVGGP